MRPEGEAACRARGEVGAVVRDLATDQSIPPRAGRRLAEEAGLEWLTVDPRRRKLAIACCRPSAR